MDERIKKVFEKALELKSEELNKLTDDSSIYSVSHWDSLGHLKLIVALEEKFSVSITNFEAIELVDIAQIKKVLGSKGVCFDK